MNLPATCRALHGAGTRLATCLTGQLLARRDSRDSRRAQRDERGSMILEALIIMFVLTVTAAGAVGVLQSVRASADRQQAQTAIDQHLTGLGEEAMAMPWTSVVACRTPLAVAPAGGWGLTPPVQATVADCPTPGIAAARTVTIEDRDVAIATDVTWVLPSATPPAPAPAAPTDPGAYGLKRITLTATWTNPGSQTPSSTSVVIERLPTLDEAAPR